MARRTARWGLLLATLALIAIAGEAAFRERAAQFRRGLEEARGWDPEQGCNRSDPRLVYRGVAGRCRANSRGFADAERAFAKPPGVFRVVVIGDSIALGHPKAREHSFAKLLEQRIREARPDRPVEVIVLATVGYSSQQELVLLEDEALLYAPDLVLWSYCLNDPAHPYFHDPSGHLGRYLHRPSSYFADFLAEKAFFVRERFRASRRRCPREFHAFLHCAYAEEVEELFATLGRWQTENAVPIVVAIHPLIEQNRSPETYSLRPVHETLERLSSANGLVAIDLLPAYRGHAWEEIGLGVTDGWFDCYHPNRFGHLLVAQYLEEKLRGRSLVP